MLERVIRMLEGWKFQRRPATGLQVFVPPEHRTFDEKVFDQVPEGGIAADQAFVVVADNPEGKTALGADDKKDK